MRRGIPILFLLGLCGLVWGCAGPTDPSETAVFSPVVHDGSLRIAALDYQVGDLNDPEVMKKYERVDILIVLCSQFWGRPEYEGKIALLKAANPDLKVIGYFRAKTVREEWGTITRESQSYVYDLYQASLPYWVATTTGDTATDWPGAILYDITQPAAREAMLDVFDHYQSTSSNKFDGIFWDYFATRLWIAPAVHNMDGDPDMDSNGIGHWDDPGEIESFLAGQDAWVEEMESRIGAGFIQIANGMRAAKDSTFAGRFDGIFYEIFPDVGFYGTQKFAQAMDPDHYNNLFAAQHWPRKQNGGPWLILSHIPQVGSYRDEDGAFLRVDPGNINRVVALLTGATAIHYDSSGLPYAGIPDVELNLGQPLGPTRIEGTLYSRDFEFGSVEMEMESGSYPVPFSYRITEKGTVIDQIMTVY